MMKSKQKFRQSAASTSRYAPPPQPPPPVTPEEDKLIKQDSVIFGNLPGNGGTLENSMSNVFSLIELIGLKWRCYITPSSAPRGVHLSQDDILKAYGKCVQDGIICTWRRKPSAPNSSGHPEQLQIPSFTNDICKELWVFWYGSEPEKLEEYCAKLEQAKNEDIDSSSSPPVTYEVRTLFFKALHMTIERTSSKEGFLRIGRWFCRPYLAENCNDEYTMPEVIRAFNYQFFVHGGNYVCATVTNELKPALMLLGRRHLDSKKRVKVIVSPWSWRAEVIPAEEAGDPAKIQSIQAAQLEEFKSFFPMDEDEEPETEKDEKNQDSPEGEEETSEKSDNKMPKMVCIDLAGVRFHYPSSLLCLTMDQDKECRSESEEDDTPETDEPNDDMLAKRNPYLLDECEHPSFFQGVVQSVVINKRTQVVPPTPTTSDFATPYVAQADDETKWNFVDPAKRELCACKHPKKPELGCHPGDTYVVKYTGLESEGEPNLQWEYTDKKDNSYHIRTDREIRTKYIREAIMPRPRQMITEFTELSDEDQAEIDMEEQARVKAPWMTQDKPDIGDMDLDNPTEDYSSHYPPASSSPISDRSHRNVTPFTPVRVVSPCGQNCEYPADQELTKDQEASCYKEVQRMKKDKADEKETIKEYHYDPREKDSPEFEPYHNKRIGEKRRPTYPPPLPIPLSPEQPGSQETIPATASPLPADEINQAETNAKLMMRRNFLLVKPEEDMKVIYSKKKLEVNKNIRVKSLEFLDAFDELEDFNESDEEISSFMFGRCSFAEKGSPKYLERESPEKPEPIFDAEKDDSTLNAEQAEPMEVDNMLSPPASNEQYQPLSLKATGPPSVPDANQIYPTPPSVLEVQQFSPSGLPIASGPHHAPLVPSQLIGNNDGEAGDVEMENIEDVPKFLVKDELEPGHEVNDYFGDSAKIEESKRVFKKVKIRKFKFNGPTMDNRKYGVRFDKEKMAFDPNEVLPIDYLKLARQQAQRPQKPHIEMPKSAPRTVGSSSIKTNMISLDHENRSENANSKAYQVSFAAIQQPVIPQHPMYPPYQRGGMPMRPGMPGMGHPGYGQMGYGGMGMQYNPMGGPMGVPGGYPPHMANPMYSGHAGPMPPMGGMPMSPMGHGPIHPMGMGHHMGPPMGMPPMGMHGMNPAMYQHQMQTQRQQMYLNQMHQMNQMGGMPMTPMGGMPQSPLWDQQHMGGMMPQISSPVNAMPSPLGMQPQMGGMSGPGYSIGPPVNQQPITPMNSSSNVRAISPPSPTPTIAPYEPIGPLPLNRKGERPFRIPMFQSRKERTKTAEKFAPEGSSIVLTIILQDTILDLHYDITFDSCPLCSCNVTIRTKELGVYLCPPEILRKPPFHQHIPNWSGFYSSQNHQNACNCGFSAVRHRYLSMYNGLFPEDSQEATGVAMKDATTPALGPWAEYDHKSALIKKALMDSTTHMDRAVMNQLRVLCMRGYMGEIINELARAQEEVEKAFAPEDDRCLPGSNAQYVMSYVDQTELLLLGNSAVDAALIPNRGPDRTNVSHNTFFHPWGLQIANEVAPIEESDLFVWDNLQATVKPLLEKSMRIVKQNCEITDDIVEGPLSWTDLSQKRQNYSKTEDNLFQPEPVPSIWVTTNRELVMSAPTMIGEWENLNLAPVDQPKDILYMTVIPDNLEVHSVTLKYMEGLGQLYERYKLGKHIPLCFEDVRDGIIRAGGRSRQGSKYIPQNTNFSFIEMCGKHIDDKKLIQRLRLFTQQMEEAVMSVLERHEYLFSRDEFRRQIAQEARYKKQINAGLFATAEKAMEKYEREQEDKTGKEALGGYTTERRQSSALEELLNSQDSNIAPSNPALSASLDPPLEPDEIPQDDYPALPHMVCIYIVNPFAWNTDNNRSAVNARIALTALIRSFNAICQKLKPLQRTQLMLEIVPLEEVYDYSIVPDITHERRHRGFGNPNCRMFDYGKEHKSDSHIVRDPYTKSLLLGDRAFSIYKAPRVLTPECVRAVQARFMTKCGPGYNTFSVINDWARMPGLMQYHYYPTLYHLAPSPILQIEGGKVIQRPPGERVLYFTYCIVGGEFLLAAVTDELGKLNDNCIINIKPNTKTGTGYKFKAHTQIQDAMLRLMQYVHGIVTMDIKNCRLVIGRLGKMGHGEFKAWNSLLSKNYLRKLSSKPKDGCKPCHDSEGASGMPKIISACCISFEAEPFVRIYAKANPEEPIDQTTPPPSTSKDKTPTPSPTPAPTPISTPTPAQPQPPVSYLNTPGDISVTHIMTCTVNTTIDLSAGEQTNHDADDEMDFEMDFGGDLGLGNEFDSIMDDVGNTNLEGATEAPGHISRFRSGTIDISAFEHTGESIQNQPLAIGYYISTAPAPDLPDWFWSSCPTAKKNLPLHFKASLHINIQNIGADDEDLTVSSKSTAKQDVEYFHPLDSIKTDAVLRHVLETFNALSWLNVARINNNERVSCLPIHMQHLLRLYHAIARIYLSSTT